MILLFVGAGGSAAVDHKQFPTTLELFTKYLPKKADEYGWFNYIKEFTHNRLSQIPDIEELIWDIDELINHYATSIDPNKIGGYFSHKGIVSGSKINIEEITLEIEKLSALKNSLYEVVHSLYGVWKEEYVDNPWKKFLDNLLKLEGPLEIFTTNYDKIFECTISLNGLPIELGRTYNPITDSLIVDTNLWTGESDKLNKLTKLHGSVTWKWVGPDEKYVECTNLKDIDFDYTRNAILYPGHKGRPSEYPFSLFYMWLEHVAAECKAAIFVGYSFRDEEINRILIQGIGNRDIRIAVIGGGTHPPKGMPFSKDDIYYFEEGFTEKMAYQCFECVSVS